MLSLVGLLFGLLNPVWAQMDTLWTKNYHWDGRDEIYDHIQTSDGGYALTGGSTLTGTEEPMMWVLKTDGNGDTLWSSFIRIGQRSYGRSIFERHNRELVVVGDVFQRDFIDEHNVAHADVIFTKFSPDGDSLHTRRYTNGYSIDRQTWLIVHKSILTRSGDYLVSGTYGINSEEDYYSAFFLFKLDENGDSLWFNVYGTRGLSQAECFDVIENANGEYVMVGYGCGYLNGPPGHLLIVADENGDSLTSFSYQFDRNAQSEIQCIEQLPNGNYLLSSWLGHTPEFPNAHMWTMIVNSEGRLLRDQIDGERGSDYLCIPYASSLNSDGNVIVLVTSRIEDARCTEIWQFDSNCTGNMLGRWANNRVTFNKNLTVLPNGYISISGYIQGRRWPEYDPYLALISPDLEAIESIDPKYKPDQFSIDAFPNPFNSQININIINSDKNLTTFLYDSNGKVVQSWVSNEIQPKKRLIWNAENYPAGTYYLKVINTNNTSVRSLILQR